jgi:hypothetical protein
MLLLLYVAQFQRGSSSCDMQNESSFKNIIILVLRDLSQMRVAYSASANSGPCTVYDFKADSRGIRKD